jgi:hypothetical protein
VADRTTWRITRDWALALGSLCVLIAILVRLDARVAGAFSLVVTKPVAVLAPLANHARAFADDIIDRASDRTMGYSTLVTFACAGVVLLLVMTRVSRVRK